MHIQKTSQLLNNPGIQLILVGLLIAPYVTFALSGCKRKELRTESRKMETQKISGTIDQQPNETKDELRNDENEVARIWEVADPVVRVNDFVSIGVDIPECAKEQDVIVYFNSKPIKPSEECSTAMEGGYLL